MSKFASTFQKVLLEADTSDLERNAMEGSLDGNTDPTAFDTDIDPSSVEMQTTDEVADAMSRRNAATIAEMQSWINEIEQFLSFLNGEQPDSIQSRLAAAEPDTVMDKMKQSQQTKISRVASDLASLHQSFLGFMAQTKNTKFKYV